MEKLKDLWARVKEWLILHGWLVLVCKRCRKEIGGGTLEEIYANARRHYLWCELMDTYSPMVKEKENG